MKRQKSHAVMVSVVLTMGIIATCLLLMSWVWMYQTWKMEMANYESENQCIQQYIYQGVDRADIKRDNGVCYVRREND